MNQEKKFHQRMFCSETGFSRQKRATHVIY